jgi:hypothetical protein
MNTQNPFKQLLPEHLSDEAAYSLWECFHELAMACEKKYAHQINRKYAQQCMLDATEHDDVLPGKGDRQIEMPF